MFDDFFGDFEGIDMGGGSAGNSNSIFGDVVDFFSSNKLASGLASAAITGFALNAVSGATKQPNSPGNTTGTTATDYGQLLQIPAAQDTKIPVLYGRATVAGIITEAVQSNNGATMTYVITLSEKTGTGILGNPSTYIFENIYWDNKRIIFVSDGITASYVADSSGNIDRNIDGLVKVWCYAGGSELNYNQAPAGYTVTPSTAYANVPNWDATHSMNDLIFLVVQVTYSRDKGVTGLPNITVTLDNSLTQPGDVLYDYLTNTRYGAGIPVGDIYAQ